ncbi:hypothetical protein [Novosphingobium sp.]|uniref:hypothetical protein n=1 Tax=Novosphingobium sp. TaxID=1874826 RepID=UPI00286E4900|nr:hypothetical protein [Novosphingobium sp.]
MMNMKSILTTAIIAATVAMANPAAAQETNYKLGTVWTASRINVLPGQFENYMDYLASQWKRVQEFGKKEGVVLSYHVLTVNNPRKDEPNVILLVEAKDYMTIAQQDAFSGKLNAFLAMDDRKQDAASGARGPMRELWGSTEYQELILK